MWKGKKQMVKALDKPPLKKELKRLEGKKMTMSSSLSSFVISKTRSFFLETRPDEGFLAKDPALWEEDDRFKDARNGHLASEWSTMPRSGASPYSRATWGP
ncbi:hypothetical protein GWK47_053848 [Chionoecetes opilio]|uniref:Uncharacterized protein n=1 Tax=Chionoecetes opilio TaxID=41210 RepID=A0A8J4Y6M9_CHIOP|nr:hypothetical protein GWK47_053848 [Chionoecetes opilio]